MAKNPKNVVRCKALLNQTQNMYFRRGFSKSVNGSVAGTVTFFNTFHNFLKFDFHAKALKDLLLNLSFHVKLICLLMSLPYHSFIRNKK